MYLKITIKIVDLRPFDVYGSINTNELAKCFMLMRLRLLSDCSCQEDSSNEYANYNRNGAYAICRYIHVCASINTRLYGRGMFPGIINLTAFSNVTQLFKIIDRFTSFASKAASRSAVCGSDKLLMARKCRARARASKVWENHREEKSTVVVDATRVKKSFQQGTNKSGWQSFT